MKAPVTETLPPIQRDGTYVISLRLLESERKPFDFSAYTPALDIDSLGNLPLTANAAEGEITLTLTAAETKALPETPLHYVLWLEQNDGAERWPILEGAIPVHTPTEKP